MLLQFIRQKMYFSFKSIVPTVVRSFVSMFNTRIAVDEWKLPPGDLPRICPHRTCIEISLNIFVSTRRKRTGNQFHLNDTKTRITINGTIQLAYTWTDNSRFECDYPNTDINILSLLCSATTLVSVLSVSPAVFSTYDGPKLHRSRVRSHPTANGC